MNSSPTVSVICPTYNRQDLLPRAIQSVLNQTYKNFELIVIDDGSTDGTEKVVGSFKDERIRYIRLEKNMGAGAARNRGIEGSRGKYIAFQDSDDEWLPEKLEKQIEVFKTIFAKVGVVYTDMLRIHSDGRAEYWHSPTLTDGCIIDAKKLDYQVRGLGILSTLIKRECLQKDGFFDEKFPAFEDLELFIKLSKHFGFYHIQEPLVKYYEMEGISSNQKAEATARILLLEKYYGDVKKNKKFISNQYFLISKILYSCVDVVEGRKYLLKAILACPLYKEPLFLQFKIIFGDNAYVKLRKFCRKVKSTWRQLLY